MPISRYVRSRMSTGSWIRRMFEAGRELRQRHGDDAVFDLSLGNPVAEPPPEFFEVLRDLSGRRGRGDHRYMSNAGLPEVREAVACDLTRRGIFPTRSDRVVMTVGAGGGLNIILRTLLDPGDEVILLAPYFVEYLYYVENYGGVPRVVQTDEAFDLDLAAIDAAIGPRTRAILVNSPNNPTGRVYPRAKMEALVSLLKDRSRRLGRPLYLVSDEPYRPIVYDGGEVPNVLGTYPDSFLVFSWSKALHIPGDRIGYVAVHEQLADSDVVPGLVFANRTLGFVNAPATLQLAVAKLLASCVDVAPYQRARDLLYAGLVDAGYGVVKPEGAFYMFPSTPVDDVRFCEEALKEKVLVVPGSGFGRPGHMRLSYCVAEPVLAGAIEGLGRVRKRFP